MKQRKLSRGGRSIAAFGLLGALAVVIAAFESALLPALPFLPPGAKPGLSNIVTTFATVAFSLGGGVYVTLCKAAFALLTRGGTAGFMSLAGGMFAAVALWLLLRLPQRRLSYIGVSVLAAVCHNAGQLVAAAALSGTPALFHYGKYLLPLAALTGFVTGVILNIVMPRIRAVFDKHFRRKDAHP